MLTVNDFQEAAARLKNVIHTIPLSTSCTFSQMTGADVYLKYENQQKTGSFKVRGAYNKIMKRYMEGNLKAVVATSAGNHAQGVAFAAASVGVPATIVMPRSAPIAKVAATEGYGAKVVLHGSVYDETVRKAEEIIEKTGAELIHPFNDEDVMAGQGTIGLEILSDLPTVDMVFVPAGGGGLISGIASCVKQINPRIQVIGVQAEGASAIVNSFHQDAIRPTETAHTIADGIAVKEPGDLTMQYINQYVDQMVTVSDAEIAATILLLLERTKQVVEPAGAASLAAVLNHQGKKVVCVLSGGNIDVSFIHKIVEKGLVTRHRHIKFSTVMPDVPGSLERFAHIVAEQNANVILFNHDRVAADLDIDEAIIEVVCEVSGDEHAPRSKKAATKFSARSRAATNCSATKIKPSPPNKRGMHRTSAHPSFLFGGVAVRRVFHGIAGIFHGVPGAICRVAHQIAGVVGHILHIFGHRTVARRAVILLGARLPGRRVWQVVRVLILRRVVLRCLIACRLVLVLCLGAVIAHTAARKRREHTQQKHRR